MARRLFLGATSRSLDLEAAAQDRSRGSKMTRAMRYRSGKSNLNSAHQLTRLRFLGDRQKRKVLRRRGFERHARVPIRLGRSCSTRHHAESRRRPHARRANRSERQSHRYKSPIVTPTASIPTTATASRSATRCGLKCRERFRGSTAPLRPSDLRPTVSNDRRAVTSRPRRTVRWAWCFSGPVTHHYEIRYWSPAPAFSRHVPPRATLKVPHQTLSATLDRARSRRRCRRISKRYHKATASANRGTICREEQASVSRLPTTMNIWKTILRSNSASPSNGRRKSTRNLLAIS